MTVRSLLTAKASPAVHTAAPSDSLRTVAERLSRPRIGALPVVSGGRVVGLIGERELAAAIAEYGNAALVLPIRALMLRDVPTCKPESSLQRVMATMTTRRLRHLPVLEGGRLVGLVSIGDVVKHRLQAMETEAGVLRDYFTLLHPAAALAQAA